MGRVLRLWRGLDQVADDEIAPRSKVNSGGFKKRKTIFKSDKNGEGLSLKPRKRSPAQERTLRRISSAVPTQ